MTNLLHDNRVNILRGQRHVNQRAAPGRVILQYQVCPLQCLPRDFWQGCKRIIVTT
ncbi:hypothetical protein D1872_343210 [compost metagenome]